MPSYYALKGTEETTTVNPDKFISENDEEKLDGLQCTTVEYMYKQRKHVEDQDGKKHIKIIKTTFLRKNLAKL